MIDAGKWALNNRKLVYFVIAALFVGGIFAINSMGKLEDPEIKVPMAMIITPYPGASAHQVEMEVTDVLERNISLMGSVDEITSRSMNDVSIIYVALHLTIPVEEIEQNWDLLRRKVGDTPMPEGIQGPIVMDFFGDVYGMFYAITADGYSGSELNDYVELAKREIQGIEGISSIMTYGEKVECINVDIRQDKMANLGVLPLQIISTLNSHNKKVYSGYYLSGEQRLKIAVGNEYESIDDVQNLIIQGHQKDQLRLKDIANIYFSYAEPIRNEMFYDGVPAVGFAISAKSDTDITKIGKLVEERIVELKESSIPAGIDFHKIFFQPDKVNEALGDFTLNLSLSLIIVIVVLMLTMGFRSGVIIAVNLVVIVLGTIFVLNSVDGTLQRISLGAFVLAMGMLVDNAIVIVDGILVDLKRGVPRKEALTGIGKKTAMPLLGATMIAILSFYPIYLSPDMAGVYIRDLFVVLAVSLLLSWILAITFAPVFADKYLRIKEARSKKQEEDNKDPFDTKAYQILRNTLTWLLGHRTLTVMVAVVLVLSSVFCYFLLPQGFFPDMSYNQCFLEYKLPEGTRPEQVKKDLAEIEAYLRQNDNITNITTAIGGTPTRYNLVRSIATPSMSYGELIIDFETEKDVVESVEEIQNYLTENYPQAIARVKRYNLMYKRYPIELQFRGPDPAVLKDLAGQAQTIMQENPNTILVNNDWEPEIPYLLVDYNQPIAREYGVSRSDVGLSLLLHNEGAPIATYFDGRHKHPIYIKSVGEDGQKVENLENISVFTMMPQIPEINKNTIMGLMTGSVAEEDILGQALSTTNLSQIANGVNLEWEEPVVLRYNGQRAMTVSCEPNFGITPEVARKSLLPLVEKINLPDGYSMRWFGEYDASKQSTKYLFENFPLAIMLMIVILLLLFKDYKKPIIILCCIPLLFVGVVYGLLLTGKIFGFIAIVGIIGLVGMMLKNGIILMDEIKLLLDSGVEPIKALLDSSSSRFRPVMMASITTILGMIPLVFDDFFGSLAVTIMGGLLVGTIITLLFIPILYSIFFNIKTR